jgi:hypothetical protein
MSWQRSGRGAATSRVKGEAAHNHRDKARGDQAGTGAKAAVRVLLSTSPHPLPGSIAAPRFLLAGLTHTGSPRARMAPKKGASKKKPGAADHNELPSHTDLLSLIEDSGELPLENKLQLLHCGQPACPPGCKGGRKDNPACLCGLIPEEGRFKKSGLFQKLPAVLGELGIDPSTQRRPVRLALRAARACFAAALLLRCLARCLGTALLRTLLQEPSLPAQLRI